MTADKYTIIHRKGADSTTVLTIYYDGEPVDWTKFDGNTGSKASKLIFHIHAVGGSAVKDLAALTATTFPVTTDGTVTITIADDDQSTSFSGITPGEYVWFLMGTTLTAASGKTPCVTGEWEFARGRFILSAADGATDYQA